jgi:hypothetical protein
MVAILAASLDPHKHRDNWCGEAPILAMDANVLDVVGEHAARASNRAATAA